MNERSPAAYRRFDPALELPFTLGGLRVSPATLELARDGSTKTIELRMMQVLTALQRRLGHVVSRDDLSLLCWDGRVVGDDALNRVISRLRKALSADPAVVIDTIPKVGYRLRVEGVEAAVSGTEQRRSRIPLIAAGSLLLVILVIAVMLGSGRNSGWTVETMRPLTRDPGIEIFPALSPDGRQLAYSGGLGSYEATDIYLRGTALGETRPQRLTDTTSSEMSPAWSPDGARLAFVRIGAGVRPCEIVIMTLPDRAERSAGRCRQARATKIDWLGARTILYSDGPSAGPWRLFALDINSGTSRPLTSPGTRMLGDSAPTVSPDSRHIAFRRTVTHGNDDILLLDRASGAVRPLGVGGWKGIGLAWAPDSRTLFMTSNRGGAFGLWSIDIDSKGPPQRVSQSIVALGQISADRSGNLSVETIRSRTNLFAFKTGADPEPVTTADGNDWDPDISPDGITAFGSDVSGSNELWIKRPAEDPVRLTQLRGSYIYSPRWSSDGRRIVFIGAGQGRSDVYTIDADGSRLRRLTTDGVNKGMVAWVGPSELVYTEEGVDGWGMMRVDGGGRRPVPGSRGLIVVRRSPDGVLFGRGATPDLLRLGYKNGNIVQSATGLLAPVAEAWTPTRDGIYWVENGFEGPWAIRFTSWSRQSRMIGSLQSFARPALALRPADGAVLVPRLIEESSDLMIFEVRRN